MVCIFIWSFICSSCGHISLDLFIRNISGHISLDLFIRNIKGVHLVGKGLKQLTSGLNDSGLKQLTSGQGAYILVHINLSVLFAIWYLLKEFLYVGLLQQVFVLDLGLFLGFSTKRVINISVRIGFGIIFNLVTKGSCN